MTTNKTRWFAIYQQISPPASQPYRLLETNLTSDGPRTRVADGTWKTYDDALAEQRKREGTVTSPDGTKSGDLK